MKPVFGLAATAAALAMFAPLTGRAQSQPPPAEVRYGEPGIPAPVRALELTIGTGYTQGFGVLQPGVGMPQVANAGIGVNGSVGFRIDHHFGVSFGAEYQELQPERADATRAFASALALQYHIVPNARTDPWVEIGSGYRAFIVAPAGPGNDVLFHGPQLVRARAGLDIRLSPNIAVAPVIGADATMFVIRDDLNVVAIGDPTISTFVFAGLQGRMDVGGL